MVLCRLRNVCAGSRLRTLLVTGLLVVVTLVGIAWQGLVKAAPSEQHWGDTLNGLRMRVTAPTAGADGTVVYRRGHSVPLKIEIENVSDTAIPFSSLIGQMSFKVVNLKGERIGVQGYLETHMTSWQKASGSLPPGDRIRDVVYLERMRWRLPKAAGKTFHILIQLPTQKPVPNQLPINAYANPITVALQDSPFEHSLQSADLPDVWQNNMEIEYVEQGMFFGYMGVHIDGRGCVTTLGQRLRSDELILDGRFEYMLDASALDEFMRLLRQFDIERLTKYDQKRYATDLVQVHLCIAAGPHTLVGQYEVFGDKTPEVVEFRRLIRGVLANRTHAP